MSMFFHVAQNFAIRRTFELLSLLEVIIIKIEYLSRK